MLKYIKTLKCFVYHDWIFSFFIRFKTINADSETSSVKSTLGNRSLKKFWGKKEGINPINKPRFNAVFIFEYLRNTASFEIRTVFMCVLAGFFYVWQILEIRLKRKSLPSSLKVSSSEIGPIKITISIINKSDSELTNWATALSWVLNPVNERLMASIIPSKIIIEKTKVYNLIDRTIFFKNDDWSIKSYFGLYKNCINLNIKLCLLSLIFWEFSTLLSISFFNFFI